MEELKRKAKCNLNKLKYLKIAKEIWLDKLTGKIVKMGDTMREIKLGKIAASSKEMRKLLQENKWEIKIQRKSTNNG